MKRIGKYVRNFRFEVDPRAESEPEPCAVCSNRGWVYDQHKQPTHCPANCESSQANRRRIAGKYQRDSQLPSRYQDFTFETWRQLPASDKTGKVLAGHAAQAFAQNPHSVSLHSMIKAVQQYAAIPAWMQTALTQADVVRPGYVLSGSVGTGKTGLCVAAMNALLAAGTPVLYMRVLDVLKALSQTWQNGGEKELLERFKNASVLFLDDFGMDSAPLDYQKAYMQIIVRHRHGNELPTMATTNLTRDQFTAAWGAQTSDALFELCHWIPVGGAKLRDTHQAIEEF